MKTIEAVKHLVCWEQKDFITQLTMTIKTMEDNGLEVDVQYSNGQGTWEALIIGRREINKNGSSVDTASVGSNKETKAKRTSKVQDVSKK